MADQGEYAEFIDSANVTLTNDSNADVFKQLFNITVFRDSIVTKRTRTDSVIEKHFDPLDLIIEADIYLTEPEAITWANLIEQTNNLPTATNFTVSYTAENGNTTTQTGTFGLVSLRFFTPEEGPANYHIRLESTNGVMSTT